MNNISILYIEDNAQAREHYARAFRTLFKRLYIAEDAEKGFALYEEHRPDILLVDIELPGENGLSLIRRIRESDKETIIIILSAFSQQTQLLQAIELGLYKYLIKPVNSREFISVLKESIEMVKMKKDEEAIVLCGELKWQSSKQLLLENRDKISLSRHENRLISLLASNPNAIYTLWDIADFVWEGEEEPSQQAIKNLINRLRKKVSVDFIRNIYGEGYQLCS